MISSSLLHLCWKSVSEINYQTLLSLSDLDLSQTIIQKVRDRIILNTEESRELDTYLGSKILLIRDLACAL